MPRNKVLIAGASGLVGFAAVRHFSQFDDWDVVAVSRRAPAGLERYRAKFIPVDLLNQQQCNEVFGAMSNVRPSLRRRERKGRRPGTRMARPRANADEPGDDARSVRAAVGSGKESSACLVSAGNQGLRRAFARTPPADALSGTLPAPSTWRTSTGCRKITSAASKPDNAGIGACSARNWLLAKRSAAT